jgi:lipid-A-disaccharide synthase-like uncharacterized protein
MTALSEWLAVSFSGQPWDNWQIIGWLGNAVFFSRFFVQWWASERKKQVVVPNAFWWLSIAGSGFLLLYGIHKRDLVFIFAYLFTWIPYIRNLVLSYRQERNLQVCHACQSPGQHSRYCPECGARLGQASTAPAD